MFSITCIQKSAWAAHFCASFLSFLLILNLVAWAPISAAAQQQSSQPSSDQAPNAQNPNRQEAPPEAGGPNGDAGPYAIPKKGEEQPPPPPPERPKKVAGMPDYSIHVDVPVVTVPVMVTTKNGQFISNLKKENFRVYEDGTPQTISDFRIEEAPITAVLLVEFASTTWPLLYDALQASYIFASTLKKDDWVAVVSYDMKPDILVDFTQDKSAVMAGLNTLRMPGFSETNLFDALYDTLDRLDRVEGHKYIVLVSTGIDTFSKLNLDQITKKVKSTHDVTIFSISIGWMLREYCETHHCTGMSHGMASMGMQQIDWYQADNEMQTFARLTGGRFYQPRFEGDFVDTFKDISGDIRHEYMIAYHPTNTKLDGTYRKLKVDVVAPDGGPLKIQDQKHKDVKYQVIAREGYTAKHTVD
ncbi:MAG TPA: VWA domain-containing protein [Terriglobales bacterium]|nr:VWA domain-containing protein [Terriglobales bacterium]